MDINLLEIWGHMGLPVRAVVIFLTLQAIACVAVVIDRALMLAVSRARTRRFVEQASAHASNLNAERMLKLAEEAQSSHLASFVAKGLRSYVELKKKGQGGERATELTRRALERKTEPLSRDLNRFMNVLASTGSTAPFVGLLGTVLGIMHAFKLIAGGGGGGIATIGPAIAEALIVTGYGLTVAIPVVLVFNWLSGKLASYEGDILNAAGDLLDRLEIGGDVFEPGHDAKREEPARVLSASPTA